MAADAGLALWGFGGLDEVDEGFLGLEGSAEGSLAWEASHHRAFYLLRTFGHRKRSMCEYHNDGVFEPLKDTGQAKDFGAWMNGQCMLTTAPSNKHPFVI